jgi:hypothetical protein
MEQFIRCQNVERYCRLLEDVAKGPKRQTIIELLAEERQKQKDAGDLPNFPLPGQYPGFVLAAERAFDRGLAV